MTARAMIYIACLLLAMAACAQEADPLPAPGVFTLSSEPAGARVDVSPPGDPRFYPKGTTPCEVTVDQPREGLWTVRVSLPGHLPAIMARPLPSGELSVALPPETPESLAQCPLLIQTPDDPPAAVSQPPFSDEGQFRLENAAAPVWSPTRESVAHLRGGEVVLWSTAGERALGPVAPDEDVSAVPRVVFTPDGEYVASLLTRVGSADEPVTDIVISCLPVGGGDRRTFPLGQIDRPAQVTDFAIDPMGQRVAVLLAPSGDAASAGPIAVYALGGSRDPQYASLAEGDPAPTAVAFDPSLPSLWTLLPADPEAQRPVIAVQYLLDTGAIARQASPSGVEPYLRFDRLVFSPGGNWLAAAGETPEGPRAVLLPWRELRDAYPVGMAAWIDWGAPPPSAAAAPASDE
jgi:hypothetical protein